MLESARGAEVGSGQTVVRSSPYRCDDSMLRNLPQRRALLWDFISCRVPLSFGYCKWKLFSLYFLRFFFFLPIICFRDSFSGLTAHSFDSVTRDLEPL